MRASSVTLLLNELPLATSLDTLVQQTENRALRSATAKVAQDVIAGVSLSEALRKRPDIFPGMFINMVAAAEIAGNLEEVLARLSTFMEKQSELRQKILTALFYPIVLLIMSVGVVILVVLTVLPVFVKMFTEAGVPLPLPTKILYDLNLFLRGWWHVVLGSIIAAVLALNFTGRTKIGKAIFDRIILDTPFIGSFVRKVNIARFATTLSSMLSSGVPMLQALEALSLTTDNSIFSDIFKKAQVNIGKGITLADQLKSTGEFPPMPIKMIAVGEETGKLEGMLSKVADFYEMSVDYSVKRLTTILEPLILVVLGGLIAFIFASVLLPIFNMVKVIRP